MTPLPANQSAVQLDVALHGQTARKPPVFIVGSPRSGTTLLYHMLLSSGGFAVYMTESKVFDLVFPRAGDLTTDKSRRKALDLWLDSRLFSLSGLERNRIEAEILTRCRNRGDFLRIVMEEIADLQHAERWADNTPEHILYLTTIKNEIPDSKIIHILRDGRDVALSLSRKHWIRTFPWDMNRQLLVAGLYWEWLVLKGRLFGHAIGSDYLELRFEDLLSRPNEQLAKIGVFIDHDLDPVRVRQRAIGSVRDPNTSFREEFHSKTSFDPVGRWRRSLSREEIATLERLIGATLTSLGYALASPNAASRGGWQSFMRTLYGRFWDSKFWLKTNTPLARVFANANPGYL